MPRNNASAGVGGMLDGLKSRLGFSREGDNYDDRYDDRRDDRYDDRRDDYDDYDEFSEYGDDYDDNAPIGGYRPASTSSSSRSGRRFGRADSTPSLVSIDDVKASTPLPERLQRDPLESTRESYTPPTSTRDTYTSTTTRGGRNLIDNTAPAPSSPAHNAAMREQRTRSEGLDSLFEPSAANGYDPYEAYSSSNPTSHVATRTLTVIKPTVYADVERVARAVKSGDVVVLVMRNTPDDLSKRLLDFSFGVASALDASVECPGEKVFAITRGNALSEDEKRRLRSQGAL